MNAANYARKEHDINVVFVAVTTNRDKHTCGSFAKCLSTSEFIEVSYSKSTKFLPTVGGIVKVAREFTLHPSNPFAGVRNAYTVFTNWDISTVQTFYVDVCKIVTKSSAGLTALDITRMDVNLQKLPTTRKEVEDSLSHSGRG